MALKFLNNGYFAGKVGIGTANPSVKLVVTGYENELASFVSTDSVSQITIADDTTTSYFGSKNGITFISQTGGNPSNGISLNSSGNVGIGTDDPDRKLHVKDSAIVVSEFEGTNVGALIDLVNSNASPSYNGIRFTQGTSIKMAITHIADGTTKGYVQIGNNWATGSEILVVDGRTSNVGIGTTTPDTKLEIVGNNPILTIRDSDTSTSTATSTIRFAESNANDTLGNYWDVGYSPVNLLNFDFNGSTKMTINSSGDVGIGTDDPSRKLQVKGTSNTAIAITSSTSNLAQLALGDTDDDNYAQILLDNSSNKLQIQNGGGGIISNRGITLDSSENVGIGTASPGAKLDISDSIPTLRITGTRDGSWTIGQTMASLEYFSEDSSGGAANSVRASINLVNEANVYGSSTGLAFSTKGDTSGMPSERMRINSSGNVGIGEANPSFKLDVITTSSRARFKAVTGDANIELSSIAGHDYLIQSKSDDSFVIYDEDASSARLTINSSGNATFAGGITATYGNYSSAVNALYFRTAAANTDYNLLTRNSTGNALFVQNAQSGTNQNIALFQYGSSTVNAGTTVLQVAKDKSYFANCNVGIGTTSPAFKLDIDGTLGISNLPFNTTSVSVLVANETIGAELLPQPLDLSTDFTANTTATTINDSDTFTVSSAGTFNGIILKTSTLTFVVGAVYKLILKGTTTASGGFTFGSGGAGGNEYGSGFGNFEFTAIHNQLWIRQTSAGETSFTEFSVKQVTSASDQIQKRELGASAFSDTEYWKANGNKIFNTNSSNVGIGTISPDAKLHVNSGTTNTVALFESTDANAKIFVKDNSTSNDYSVGIGAEGNELTFHAGSGGDERMRITSTGGISFGSTGTAYGTSGQVLTSAGNASPTWTTPTTGTVTGSGTATQVAFWDGSSSLSGNNNLYWDSTNKHLGIGDSTPGSRLKVTSGTTETSIYTVDINHVRNNPDVATHAMRLNVDLSGADNTTADRTNSALNIDIDSSANGDASNEHRIYGVNSVVNFTGFSDLVRGGYFLAESNYTGGKTAQLVGVYGYAIHDANSTAGGVSNMYGVFGISSIQDKGDVDNAFGVYGLVSIGENRTEDVGVTKAVEGEITIDKSTALNYGTMIGVSSVIDNNEGSVPNFGSQYLFKGDYQGTQGGNAYGIWTDGGKNYFSGNVGIGVSSPGVKLHVESASLGGSINDTTTQAIFEADTASSDKLYIQNYRTVAGTAWTSNGKRIQEKIDSTWMGYIQFNGGETVSSGNGDISFGTGQSTTQSSVAERMRIDSNGNVGIGTASPDNITSTGTVLSISTSGALTTNSLAGSLTFLTNDASFTNTYADGVTTQISSISESTTGAAYGLSFSTSTITSSNRAERMRISASGNVGIGTTSPNFKLDIVNAAASTATYQQFRNGTTGTASSDGTVVGIDSDGDFLINNQEAKEIKLYTSDSQRLTIQSGGNVGIGTTNPGAKLDINSESFWINPADGSHAGLHFRQAGVFKGFVGYNDSTNVVNFSMDGSIVNGINVDSSHNVGIGTASPGASLDIEPSSGDADILLTAGSQTLRLDQNSIRTTTNNNLTLFTNGNSGQLVLEQSNGNVGIGFTDPGNYKLKVNGAVSGTNIYANSSGGSFVFGASTSEGEYITRPNGTNDICIIAGGDVGIGTTSPSTKLDVAGIIRIAESGNTAFYGGDYVRLFGTQAFRFLNTGGSAIAQISLTGNSYFNGGNVGIGTTNPNTKLNVQGVVTIKGSGTATTGSLAIQDDYGSTDHLGNIGWNRSSGGPYLAYGIKQDGSADWKSTFDNFSGMRSYMKLDNNEMQLAWAPAQQTTVDTVITGLLERFTFQLDSGTLKLNAYDGTNKTGTPTYILGTDASGNVVKVLGSDIPGGGGTVTGSGTSGVLPKWNSAGTGLIDSGLSFPPSYTYADLVLGSSNATTVRLIGNASQTGDFSIKNTTGDIILQADNTTGTTAKFTTSSISLNEDTTISGYLRVQGSVQADLYIGNVFGPSDTNTGYRINHSSLGCFIDVRNNVDKITYRDYPNSTGTINNKFEMNMSSGNFTATGNIIAFGTISDRKLKENIKPIDSALDKAMKLQGVTFNWKKSNSILEIREDIGFIAQDVQKVLPELVRENKNGEFSLRHQGITPILLEAIKELKLEVEELKKQIK